MSTTESMGSVTRYVRVRTKQMTAALGLRHGDLTLRDAATAKVTCGACVACCRSYDVDLQPWESGEGLDTINVDGVRRLRRLEDGSCVHLIANRCSVYASRPAACLIYDCRDMAVAAVAPRGAEELTAAIRRWKPRLETHDDRLLYARITGIARLLMMSGLTVESAAGAAIPLASKPLAEIPTLIENVLKHCAGIDEPRRETVNSP